MKQAKESVIGLAVILLVLLIAVFAVQTCSKRKIDQDYVDEMIVHLLI